MSDAERYKAMVEYTDKLVGKVREPAGGDRIPPAKPGLDGEPVGVAQGSAMRVCNPDPLAFEVAVIAPVDVFRRIHVLRGQVPDQLVTAIGHRPQGKERVLLSVIMAIIVNEEGLLAMHLRLPADQG